MQFSFDGLVGNGVTLSLIKRSLKNEAYKQLSILSGPRGTGKTTTAGAIAMSLTCPNAKDGIACSSCDVCKANKKALESVGNSPWVHVINLGRITASDMNELIKNVFEFQSATQRQVYLFEELHALKAVKNGFTALLSEIDRMSPNTFIIGTTTELRDIKSELQSRALKFEFKRLSRAESNLFINRLLQEKGLRLPNEVISALIKHCKGIPREIEKLVDFLAENNVSLEEAKEYLQVISDYVFAELFYSMVESGFRETLEIISSIENYASVTQIIDSMKDFLVNVAFFLELDDSDTFSPEERGMIKETFNPVILNKVITIVEKLGIYSQRNDFILAMVKVSAVLKRQPESSVILTRKTEAAREKATTDERTSVKKQEIRNYGRGLHQISLKALQEFGDLRGE